jgi:predicted O-methyltransferase YrrM
MSVALGVNRLPDGYFDGMAGSWAERRRHAIVESLLPYRRYRHAFEPGCSVGTLTARLARRCDRVTATDVAFAALNNASHTLKAQGCREGVTLLRRSLEEPWPPGPFDLVVLSEVAYYLYPDSLRGVLDWEIRRLARGATVVAAHRRHQIPGYPMSGDHANDIVAVTAGLHLNGSYRDADVVIEVFDAR